MEETNAGTSGMLLQRMPFCGRTLAEYQKIFGLTLSAWRGRAVLDCPAGASSFVAEATWLGLRAVGGDPTYGREVRELLERGRRDIDEAIDAIRREPRRYNWTFYPSVPAIRKYRQAALERFARDYPAGVIQGRYVEAALPSLPFDDRRFDLVLSGHFFFTHGEHVDYDFHLASLLELYRVCRGEVRVYPIQEREGRRSRHLDRLVSEFDQRNIRCEFMPISFEFQRGSNQLLRLVRE